MPEEQEVEVKDIQESLEEHLEEDREHKLHWTRYVALTTAGLAAFAAVGTLQSGALINEALMNQIRASDTWNEYQASRMKTHLYTIQASTLIDAGAEAAKKGAKPSPGPGLKKAQAADRLRGYLDQISYENEKAATTSKTAKRLETESEHGIHTHHRFAYSVALLQVAIALGAVSALSRSKPTWLLSGAVGLVGIGLFVLGFLKM